MSIYSANRSGSMVATQEAAASKNNYSSNDLGRILYESQVNDMAIFEAVLATDFGEIKSLREGTLLESEIASFNEEAKESLGKKLLSAIDVVWKKIKDLFKTAYRKIAAYIIRSGKAFAEEYKNFIAKEKFANVKFPSGIKGKMMDEKIEDIIKLPGVDDVKNAISNATEENLASAEISALALARTLDNGAIKGMKSSEYYDAVEVLAFKERELTQNDANECVKFLESAKESIKSLRKKEDEIDAAIKELKKKVTNKDEKDSVTRNNMVVSAYQTVLSTAASTSIKVINQNIKYSRINLAAIIAAMKDSLKKGKTDDSVHEAMLLEAAAEVDEFLNNAPSVDPVGDDETVDAAVEDILTGAEE